jgi:hypothetical protein
MQPSLSWMLLIPSTSRNNTRTGDSALGCANILKDTYTRRPRMVLSETS